jgi:hypothetical protein
MRLGQLARQLETKPEKIVLFLETEKKITVKMHPNAKVEDELIEELTAHFKPITEEVIAEVVEEKVAKKEKIKAKEEEIPVVAPPEHIETVKAIPAQELKIIGKIDLPDKKEIQVEVDGVVYDQETLDAKKKEELAAEREKKSAEKEAKRKEDEERKAKAKEKRDIEAERQAMLETEKHNMLSKEEEKKKAIILKAQKERERKLEEKRKQLQKEHYIKKHAIKSKKKIKKATIAEEVKIEEQVQQQEVEKLTGFKKFLKWLNT